MLFEGAAGTGKSTRLTSALEQHLTQTPLAAEQRVLALTKYHGSRRRMHSRLLTARGVGRALDCMTIDSFAWRLTRRWRGLVRLGAKPAPVEGDFAGVTKAAGELLERPNVSEWVTRRYPVVVVDEMQDCKAGELAMLKGLAATGALLAAADGFQDLSGDLECEALLWAQGAGQVVPLVQVHRTRARGLLTAASALRNGQAITSDRSNGFELIGAPSAAAGAGRLSWRIKFWSRDGPIAIISPTRGAKSPFVSDVLSWLSTKTAKSPREGATAGPYPTTWESVDDEVCGQLAGDLGLGLLQESVSCVELLAAARRLEASDLAAWLEREQNVRGTRQLAVADVRAQLLRLIQRRRAYGSTSERARAALTVHQAKNREFPSVVILWPMRVQPNPDQQRRLLYNGITRAQKQALVIVQDPQGRRLRGAPFV